MQDLGIDPNYIILEPEPKNTAPPILASSLFAYQKDPNTILLVTPSDHVMPDIKAFHHSVKLGINQVNNGKIVTFGIKPSSPVTGYGYIEIIKKNLDSSGAFTIKRFVEKPKIEIAQKMINEGNFLWNAGIFMFRAIDMIKAFENIFQIFAPYSKAINTAVPDLGFLRINPQFWKDLIDISIIVDYGKKPKLSFYTTLIKWSDLGNWEAVWDNPSKDTSGVALSGNAHAIDCKNSLIRSESGLKT